MLWKGIFKLILNVGSLILVKCVWGVLIIKTGVFLLIFHCLLTSMFGYWVLHCGTWRVGCLELASHHSHLGSVRIFRSNIMFHVMLFTSGPFNPWSTWVTLTSPSRTKSSKLKEGYWRSVTSVYIPPLDYWLDALRLDSLGQVVKALNL